MMRWLQRLLRKGKQFPGLGSGAYVDPGVQITGLGCVEVGEGAVIGEGSWLNVNDRQPGNKAISIGKYTFVGRRAFFTCGSRITVRPYCVLGPECHFVGASHVFADPFQPFLVTGVTSEGVISVGANCFLGARVTLLADCEIGFGSVIGASAVVRGAVPPLSIAVGNPARVIKRFDIQSGRWIPANEFSSETQIPTEEEYLARLSAHDWKCRKYARGAWIAASSSLGDL